MAHAKEKSKEKIVLKLAIAILGLLVNKMMHGLLPLSVNCLELKE